MNTTYQGILASYKKANKVRRVQIRLKHGYENEADFLAFLENDGKGSKKLKTKAAKKAASKKIEEDVMLDMVVAFDTTGSMAGYIKAVRKHVEQQIEELFKNVPNLRMRIVAFGDYCDPQSTRFQSTALTNDKNKLIKFVQTSKDTSGGDSNEFYEYVIQQVNNTTEWREGSKRSFLLIGDANPHSVGYSYGGQRYNIDWKKEAARSKELGIQIDTLRMDRNVKWYSELSKMTGGVCMEFQNAEKMHTVISGLAYVRGSATAFSATMDSVVASGDSELIGAYKTMRTLLDK